MAGRSAASADSPWRSVRLARRIVLLASCLAATFSADVSAQQDVRLVIAARAQDAARMRELLGAGVDVNAARADGVTALLWAAHWDQLEAADLLLAAGADPNDTAPTGAGALVVAAHSGHGELAAWLLDQGADPNAAGAGYAPLHAAVLRGDAELVSALLDHGADPDARLARGTPHARYGKLYALEMRLAGATPFFLAAQYGFADVMRRLAAAGADPRAGLEGGVTPLMAAAGMLTPGFIQAGNDRRGRAIDTAEMELALRQDPDRRRLMNSGVDAVRAAVELGADVNAARANGDAALHAAAHHGFNTVVRYLIGQGADPNAKNARSQTPLDFALGVGRVPERNPVTGADVSTADLLRKLGATPAP